jgi:DNA-binding transcriptional LysR family regulator
MKRGRLPLTALRSFEAAGRLLSFSRAAEELFVSQAAISRQVRELEQLIGRPLFERRHRRVVLTEPGQTLLDQLTVSFDDIDRQLSLIIAEQAQSLLRVSVEPAFAAALLIPRLNLFRAGIPKSTFRSIPIQGWWNSAATRRNRHSLRLGRKIMAANRGTTSDRRFVDTGAHACPARIRSARAEG